ncbi:glycosyl transferase family protein [Candidatus Omnitrophus magneticus]|uniref:Glycosyl transferase family protein n=1 Tax=Candidatus Omnitrophus magneticus TaxID=1609969 RepID=A0A0F0CPW8_9BACT|nr:glycosyl transferase family protein [Candidatus Omnitrophus magneticus]
MNMTPLVSIITPILNGRKYISKCINSVLAQDYDLVEHIIIDGGSTDGTVDILADFQNRYPHRIVYISEPDKGPCDGWNKGWRMRRGDIVGWLGYDDLYSSNAVSLVVDYFIKNPTVYFIYGDCNIIDGSGELIANTGNRDPQIRSMNKLFIDPIPTVSSFYRTEVISHIGTLKTNMRRCDFDYWLRVNKKFNIYYLDQVLASFRMHDQGYSGTALAQLVYLKERCLIAKEHMEKEHLLLVSSICIWALFKNVMKSLFILLFKGSHRDYYSLMNNLKRPFNKLIRLIFREKK